MKIPFFGEKNSVKIEKIDDILLETQTEMNMTARKVEQAERRARDLMKRAIGASATQKKMLALQIKREYDLARVQQRKLQYHFTVYSLGLSFKQSLETKELETEGALKALQKVVGATNLTELKSVMTKLAKDEQKLGDKFAAIQADIDATQEELSATEITDTSFLNIIEELETLPPDKIDETLTTRVKFEPQKVG